MSKRNNARQQTIAGSEARLRPVGSAGPADSPGEGRRTRGRAPLSAPRRLLRQVEDAENAIRGILVPEEPLRTFRIAA